MLLPVVAEAKPFDALWTAECCWLGSQYFSPVQELEGPRRSDSIDFLSIETNQRTTGCFTRMTACSHLESTLENRRMLTTVLSLPSNAII